LAPTSAASTITRCGRGLFGNQLFGIGIEGFFFTDLATAREHLELFFAEVVPVIRAEISTPDWAPVGLDAAVR